MVKRSRFGLADAGEIGGGDSGQLVRRPHRQLAVIEHADDARGQQRAQLLFVRVGLAESADDVAAAPDDIEFVLAHRSLSLSRFSRSWIRSISAFGVLIPVFDFFWNACSTQMSSSICSA